MKVELRFNDDQVKKALKASYKRYIRQVVEANAQTTENKIKEAYVRKIKASKEYRLINLDNGKLRRALGIEDNKDAVYGIIDEVLAHTTVKVNRAQNESLTYIVPLTITLFDEKTYNGLINSEFGTYISEGKDGIFEIPWLKWLLSAGKSPVVIGYHVSRPESKYDKWSRTTRTIMLRGQSYSLGEFSGTKYKNFLTDAAIDMEKEVREIVINNILRKF